jgi:L-cysteine desulfidase
MLPNPTSIDKPGYQTTEFWLTVIAIIVSAIIYVIGELTSSGLIADGSSAAATLAIVMKIASAVSTMLAALGYQVSRAIVKFKRGSVEQALIVAREETERELRIERLRQG